VPADDPSQPAEVCPGCGAVIAPATDVGPSHPGATASCARLFEVTLRGLRDEAGAHPGAASVVALADAAYDAQHPVPGDDDRLRAALEHLGVSPSAGPDPHADGVPRAWRTTVADVAADLDVIDLTVLVESWARTVQADWTTGVAVRG
jgi:hypothetical protein